MKEKERSRTYTSKTAFRVAQQLIEDGVAFSCHPVYMQMENRHINLLNPLLRAGEIEMIFIRAENNAKHHQGEGYRVETLNSCPEDY